MLPYIPEPPLDPPDFGEACEDCDCGSWDDQEEDCLKAGGCRCHMTQEALEAEWADRKMDEEKDRRMGL